MAEWFRKFASRISSMAGSAPAFGLSLLVILVWGVMGPGFNYSDTWQLVINTGTTIITFLMVFLIQNTQNRDARAIHLKLDELIRANSHARNRLIDLQSLSDEELDRLHAEFSQLNTETEHRLREIKHTLVAKTGRDPSKIKNPSK
jgi:low affinity Fe/Cu permease